MNNIYAVWCISNNIGDALTPWLIERITGKVPFHIPYNSHRPKFMVSGSILNHAGKYTAVWGAGIADAFDPISKQCNIFAVRGPLTARRARTHAGINVEVVGDPAWVMPLYLAPGRKRQLEYRPRFKVGICPHYLHQAEVAEWIGDRRIKILNVFDSPEQFVKDMLCCDVVYSSSLHGLAIADAYGVPSRWIECTEKLGGDGMKFYDHLIVRDCLCETMMPVLDKLKLFVKYDDNHIANPKLNAPIFPLHLYQLPRNVDDLRELIINMPVPTPAARHELRSALMAVCPFKPEPLKESK